MVRNYQESEKQFITVKHNHSEFSMIDIESARTIRYSPHEGYVAWVVDKWVRHHNPSLQFIMDYLENGVISDSIVIE